MAKTVIMRTKDGNIMHLECHDTVESTVSLARKYAKAGYPDRYVVFSENQTALSAIGEPLPDGHTEKGVFLSCILRPSIFPSQASFIGEMSAVALISALEEHTTKRLGLGWISDIYCEGQKIGTVTTEGMLDSFSSYEYIIVSFSVKLSDTNFPARLTDLIKKVFESESTSVSMIIAKDILEKFASFYPKLLKSPEKFMDTFKQKFILRGVKVKYNEAGKVRKCKILGVDSADGTLIVECRGGIIKNIAIQKNVTMPKRIKIK